MRFTGSLLLVVLLEVGFSVRLAPAATFTVTSAADPGDGVCDVQCTLREALDAANAAVGADSIEFAIGSGSVSIAATAGFVVLDAVTIDATTQPGFAGAPLVELDGTGAGPFSSGLSVFRGGVTIRGLVVNRFGGLGIDLTSTGPPADGNTVAGCYIGTDASGTAAAANGGAGIRVSNSSGHLIGGTSGGDANLISGNTGGGIAIAPTSGVRVIGNRIGTNAAGNAAIPNLVGGVVAGGLGIEIGGTAPLEGNLVSGNDGFGIRIYGNGTNAALVAGNIVGLDSSGSVAVPNIGAGIEVRYSARDAVVGGTTPGARNVVAGNGAGISISDDARGTLVRGNYIGTDVSGTTAVPNDVGVYLASPESIVGGGPQARNVVAGNSGTGVQIVLNTATANQVLGNWIGVGADGSLLGNGGSGVDISEYASSNVIGAPGQGNVISGNSAYGVSFSTTAFGIPSGNLVQANLIGLGPDGATAAGNILDGIFIGNNAVGTIVGGSGAGEGNVVAANGRDGVALQGSTGAVIAGNAIGLDAFGSPAANGGSGLHFMVGANFNDVGGIVAGAGNTIAYNAGSGVWIENGFRNSVLGNGIFANGSLGLDLNVQGLVEGIDPGDSDGGANSSQNFPLLTGAVAAGGNTTIAGSLDSTPNITFRLEFFNNGACDASGFGEGERLIGSGSVTTDGAGDATFSFQFAGVFTGWATATATDAVDNTSELSACRLICGGPYGDLDESLLVDASDLVIMANYLVGNVAQGTPPFSAPLFVADVNLADGVTSADLVLLANYLVGNISCLPVV